MNSSNNIVSNIFPLRKDRKEIFFQGTGHNRLSDLLFFLLFADDTNAFLTGRNIQEMIKTVNTELIKLIMWLYINKLSLDIDKTSS